MCPRGALARPHGAHGLWGPWALGPVSFGAHGPWGPWALAPMGLGAHGLWGPWALGPMGLGAHGPWGPWALGPMGPEDPWAPGGPGNIWGTQHLDVTEVYRPSHLLKKT